MRPPQKTGENDVTKDPSYQFRMQASMRPPQKTGENRAMRNKKDGVPMCFNEAPAEDGGKLRVASLLTRVRL